MAVFRVVFFLFVVVRVTRLPDVPVVVELRDMADSLVFVLLTCPGSITLLLMTGVPEMPVVSDVTFPLETAEPFNDAGPSAGLTI